MPTLSYGRHLVVVAIWSAVAACPAFSQTATFVTLTPTPAVSVYGQSVTLTATLTGGGNGNVTFFDGATPLGDASLSGSQAVYIARTLGTGSHALRVVYVGDSTHFASTSTTVTETVNSASASGLQFQSFATNSGNGYLVSGDFNGDGKADLVQFNPGSSSNGTIVVWPGNGDGTFNSPVNTSITFSGTDSPFYTSLVTGDFNGDGKLDLAFAVQFITPSLVRPIPARQSLFTMLGNGDGSFRALREFPETSQWTVASAPIAVGDFNGDGQLDVLNPPFMNLGNGDGTFQSPMNLTNVGNPYAVFVGDFNGDGQADIASVTLAATALYSVNIQLGTGSGTFQPPTSYTRLSQSLPSVLIEDFNSDGIMDLAVSGLSYQLAQVSIFPGKGDGTFQPAIVSAAGGNQGGGKMTMAAADFNGDGILDLAVSPGDGTSISASSGLSLLYGKGDGTFQSPVNYYAGAPQTPISFLTGDFNGDGRVDLLAAGNKLLLYFGASTGLAGLTVTSVEGGTFQQAMAANYVLTVSNTGTGPTSAAIPVVVTDTLPIGLAATSISGTGWICTLSAVSCTRNDALLAGGIYAAINLSVNVASGASTPQVNMVSVTGGGAPSAAATDSTTVIANVAALQMTLTHQGNFTGGQQGAVYTITVSNGAAATGPTGGLVTVTESLPTGLTMVSMSGSGWTCPGDGTCTRSDALSPGVSWPSISVAVNVAANPFSPVVNQATASGGLSLSATASDTTTILKFQGISFGPLSNVPVGTAPFNVSALASSGLDVTFSSATTNVCTVTPGGLVTILMAGGCSVTANQSGNGTYGPAAPVTQTFTVLFSDVASTDYYYAAISALAQKGITAGCGANGYCPELNVSRDEMAIFMVRAIFGGDNFTYSSTPYYTDVTPSTFGFKWIQKLKDLGVTNGCGTGTYCPTDVVTRDQMAIFIERIRLGVNVAGSSSNFMFPATPYFNDVTAAGSFAFPWIQRLKQDGITNGCSATSYCPGLAVSRGDMAIFVMRGAFNQFLPAGTPVISSISPSTLAVGSTATYTITGSNSNFVQGTTVINPLPGVTIGTITVNSATSLTVQLTAASNAVAQPYSVLAITGSEQAVLPNGLVIQ